MVVSTIYSIMTLKTCSLFAFLALVSSVEAALVAQFSFESDFSNSVAGGATASVNGLSTPTPGVLALGPLGPSRGRVLELNGGATNPVDGLLININMGQGINSSLTSLGDAFSIAAWYRVDASPLTNSDGVNGRHFLWEPNNGNYDVSYNVRPSTGNGQSFTQGPDSSVLFSNAGFPGVWNHVVQTYEPSGSNIVIRTYINGILQAGSLNSTNTNPADFNILGLNFGMHREEGRAFDGQLDELMIWNETLTAPAISALYLSQVPEPSITLLGGIGLAATLLRRRRNG
jgi:hypothetical protein